MASPLPHLDLPPAERKSKCMSKIPRLVRRETERTETADADAVNRIQECDIITTSQNKTDPMEGSKQEKLCAEKPKAVVICEEDDVHEFKEDPKALKSIFSGEGISQFAGFRPSLYYEPPTHRMSLYDSLADYRLQRQVLKDRMMNREPLPAPQGSSVTFQAGKFKQKAFTEFKENNFQHSKPNALWHTTSKLRGSNSSSSSTRGALRRLTEEFEAVRISEARQKHTSSISSNQGGSSKSSSWQMKSQISTSRVPSCSSQNKITKTVAADSNRNFCTKSDWHAFSNPKHTSGTVSLTDTVLTPSNKHIPQAHSSSNTARCLVKTTTVPGIAPHYMDRATTPTPSLHTPRRFTPISATPVTPAARVLVKECVPSPSPMRFQVTPKSVLHQPPARVPVLTSCMKAKRMNQQVPSQNPASSVRKLRWADIQDSPGPECQGPICEDAAAKDGDAETRRGQVRL